MNTILIILAVVILASLGYFLLRKKKEKEAIVTPVVDNPPIVEDNVIIIRGQHKYTLTEKDLRYFDKEGHQITHVRFKGDIKEFYTDENHSVKYISNAELPIDFKLYIVLDPETTYVVNYDVKSNNLWSK